MPDSAAPQIISHYQLESLLGVGAMGSVYLGIDRRDGTLVAVKLIAQFLASDQEFRKRFEREAHVAALLRSPYTVHVLDYGVEAGRVFMAMQYVDGPTVREILESGPLEPARATRIALQVARALEEAEARGIVHRDVKPDNVLLGPEDTAKLADFGVARQETSRLTQTGGFYGTASYAAPEQFAGRADNRSDIYSLGATLYHMLLGRSPVSGDIEQARRRVLAGDIAFADLAPWPALRSIVEQAMRTDPGERYQTARQLAGALESALTELGGVSPSAAATVAGAPVTDYNWRAEEESLRLALKGPTTNLPFGKRYASLKYELAVTNQGQDEARVRLRAADRTNSCSFSLPESVCVPAGATSHVSFKVRPRNRRLRGPNLTRIFTIAARSGGGGGIGGAGGGRDDEGGPPVTTSGRFEDASYGWLPLGMSGLALVIALIALFVATGTGSSSSEPESLKIGLLLPFSGQRFQGGDYSAEELGEAYLNAARIAVTEINADGGVLGKPVALVQGDTSGDEDVGIQEARRLIDEETVDAIIGEINYFNTLAIANSVTNPGGVVHITSSHIPDVTTDIYGSPVNDELPYLFKIQAPVAAEGVALAQLIKDGGYDTVCLLSQDPEFISPAPGPGRDNALKNALPDVRIIEVTHTVVGVEIPAGEPDEYLADSELQQCEGAEAVVLNVLPDAVQGPEDPPNEASVETSHLLKQAIGSGLGPVFISSYLAYAGHGATPGQSPIFGNIGWEQVASVAGTGLGAAREVQGETFDKTYEGRFGAAPAVNESEFLPSLRSVYDAVYLISLAAEHARSTNSDAIRDALPDVANAPGTVVKPGLVSGEASPTGFQQAKDLIASGGDIDFEGASGPIEFNAEGDNVRGIVDIWRVDAPAQKLVTERVAVVDLATGEAEVTEIGQLREYFEALEALDQDVNRRIQALYETYPGAFEGDVEQTNALYEEYVSIFQEYLDRAPGLDPPAAVKQLAEATQAANERLNALSLDRLARLKEAATSADVDAIFFGSDPEHSQAVEGTVIQCLDLERLAAAYGIEFDGAACDEPDEVIIDE